MKKLLIAMTLLALSGLANSATVTLDFEGIPIGTDADGYSDQGVTFSRVITPTSIGNPFFAFTDVGLSPGTGVLSTDGFNSIIRADFATPTSSVSVELISSTFSNYVLSAFDSSDTLLSSQSFGGSASFGLLSLSAANIAFITIAELNPFVSFSIFSIDNFTFDVPPSAVPIPAAAILFAPALLGFMGLRRRAKKQA